MGRKLKAGGAYTVARAPGPGHRLTGVVVVLGLCGAAWSFVVQTAVRSTERPFRGAPRNKDTFAPEFLAFRLQEGLRPNCTTGQHLGGRASSLVHALQACLFHDWCGHVSFDPLSGHTELCETLEALDDGNTTSEPVVVAHRRGCRKPSAGPPYAFSTACKGPDAHGSCHCGIGLFVRKRVPG